MLMDEPRISYEEWRLALDTATKAATEGVRSAKEWATQLGRSLGRTRAWIQKGLDQGWMETGETVTKKMSGGTQLITGYRLVPPAPEPVKTKPRRKAASRSARKRK